MKNVLCALVSLLLVAGSGFAADLEQELGRNEVRVRSAAYSIVAGRSVEQIALLARLERLGYQRVRERPATPGRFFYGHETFWIFGREHRHRGRNYPAQLIGLKLERGTGKILAAMRADGRAIDIERPDRVWLEPETLAESLTADRADRIPVALDALPEHVWRALLAAEDARFFDHLGVDGRSVARAALANLKRGGVAQGGSTITQQLVKNRDLTPRRTLGRKLSEAARALMLEAAYSKREILEAYLNHVYYGHVDGLAIHGIGGASRVYFSRPAAKLTLAQAALLAAIIQGPNRLSPTRHPERARERRDWVLGRMQELDWVTDSRVAQARRSGLGLKPARPISDVPRHFLSWSADEVRRERGSRIERGRGVVVETTLDPWLQQQAEQVVADRLSRLRRSNRRLRGAGLSAALVALDASSGAVLAYVGGDPANKNDDFDRARRARRQPGSTVKPFILLEAFADCGQRSPLHAATRVSDSRLSISLPSGDWEPQNYDRRYEGTVDVRQALAASRNVPLVRIARWCGWQATADTFARAGLELPENPPPSFVLGSVETTPLDLAGAYTVFAASGRSYEPFPWTRVEKPGGAVLERHAARSTRVARPANAYLVRDLMRSAVEGGTAKVASIDGIDVAAKTGSSSELRDAWFAGHAGNVVTVVWVGLDKGGNFGLSGGVAAGPIWKEFMQRAVGAWPAEPPERPAGIVELFVDTETGLLVRERNPRSRKELFRRGARPRRDRFWRIDRPAQVVR